MYHSIFYIVRELGGWYREHDRAFELSPVSTRIFTLVSLCELLDTYPLVDYKIGSVHIVTLKRRIEKKKGVQISVIGSVACISLDKFFFLSDLYNFDYWVWIAV